MITSNHIAKIQEKLEATDHFSYPELYEWSECYLKAKPPKNKWKNFEWSHRYCTLKQSGSFYNNICAVDDLVWSAKSLDDFRIKVDLLGLPREAVDFVICYVQLNPGRFFSQDWRDLRKNGQPPLPPFSSSRECTAWYIYDDCFKEISERNLPILEVEEFLKIELARNVTRL